MTSRIRLIYDSDCPSVGEARREIEAALRTAGMPAKWEEERRDPGSHLPDAPGSPTILVDGRDVAPEDAAGRSPGGPACRVYAEGSRITGATSREVIRLALTTGTRSGVRGVAAGAAGAASTGAALASGAAAACCVGPVTAPLLVSVLGASGAAWAAGLKPYSGWFLAFGAVMLGVGFYVTRRDPACDATPRRCDRLVRATLWISAAIWLVAATVNLVLR